MILDKIIVVNKLESYLEDKLKEQADLYEGMIKVYTDWILELESKLLNEETLGSRSQWITPKNKPERR